ncbi:MAG: NuoI/complex I 23 kDa subunit family protein [Actinomycetota bacterium]
MAIDEKLGRTGERPDLIDHEVEPPELKRTTFGTGLLKGLGITLRHLFSRSVTIQYPDEKSLLPARSRGVIALKEENCTVCMLCSRECPDWCIYIEAHKERREPKEPGKRAKAYNILDRFAIDYALCMYCGICVEVCPYDALFWSPEYEYAEYDITNLTHEMPKLEEWMYRVLPPPPLDEGAQGPELKSTARVATTRTATPAPERPHAEEVIPTGSQAATASAVAPAQAEVIIPEGAPAAREGEDPDEILRRVKAEESAKGVDPRVAEARAKAAAMRARKAAAAGAAAVPKASAVPEAAAAPQPVHPEAPIVPEGAPAARVGEDPDEVLRRVREEESAKGVDPRVAEARAKAAAMRARKAAAAPQAQAPAQAEAAPARAEPDRKAPAPQQALIKAGPEIADEQAAEAADEGLGRFSEEEAAKIRKKVYDDEIAKGTDEKVAEALARTAEVRALQGFRRPDW